MGIRIEDSVAVGEGNPFVLTAEAVKEVGSAPPRLSCLVFFEDRVVIFRCKLEKMLTVTD